MTSTRSSPISIPARPPVTRGRPYSNGDQGQCQSPHKIPHGTKYSQFHSCSCPHWHVSVLQLLCLDKASQPLRVSWKDNISKLQVQQSRFSSVFVLLSIFRDVLYQMHDLFYAFPSIDSSQAPALGRGGSPAQRACQLNIKNLSGIPYERSSD